MKIVCGKLCGFCFGVQNTVDKAKEILKNSSETIYCLGDIVHNEIVIKTLEDMGMVTVKTIDEVPNNSKVIFRAHGEAALIYKKAMDKNIEVIDYTCGKVKVIHKKIEKVKNSFFIIVIGKKNHPETIGSISYANKGCIIEDTDDILIAYEKYKKTNYNKVYITSQTTFSSLKFDEYVEKIKKEFKNTNIIVDKTICDVTQNRQKEVLEISKKVNKMIIIGGKNSSNTKELYKISSENCKESIFIQSKEDLKNINFLKEDIVGVIAGASTPKEVIDEITEYLNNLIFS